MRNNHSNGWSQAPENPATPSPDSGSDALLYRHLLGDSMAPAMLVINPHDDCRVLLANASATTLLGGDGDQLSGMPLADYIPSLSLRDLYRL